MNILYVSRKDENGFIHIDYLDECLLTGLKELYGNQVVDINKKLSLYTDYPDELKHRVYGRGYTITQNIMRKCEQLGNKFRKIKCGIRSFSPQSNQTCKYKSCFIEL